MKYAEIPQLTHEQIVRDLLSSDIEISSVALLSASLYGQDRNWIQEKCLTFLDHPDPTMKATAIRCLGHLARIHKKLDIEKVLPAIFRFKDDSYLSGVVEDTLDDIKVYIKSTY